MGSRTLCSFHNGMLIEQNWSAKIADQIKSSNVQLDEDGCKLGWTAFHTSRQSGSVTSEVQEAINSSSLLTSTLHILQPYSITTCLL